jgi:citrate lyase alpha subunit
MVDNLEALVLDRFNAIEDGLKRVIARGEIVDIFQTELGLMREERKELLNRLMARDFETLQTYTGGGQQEEVGEEIKPEEDADNAGEILEVTD